MKNKLFLDFKHALFIGELHHVKHHKHTTGSLCISLGKDIYIQSANTSFQSPVFFVPQNTAIEMRCESPVLIYVFELNTAFAESVSNKLNIDKNRIAGNINRQEQLIELAHTLSKEPELTSESVALFTSIFGPAASKQREMDARVALVVEAMQKAPARQFTLEELTHIACLSKSRLSELFRTNTGLSIRRYRLWQRLLYAAGFIIEGHDFTYAAIQSGFADSAHFTHSSRKLLGLSPGELISPSHELQIFAGTQFRTRDHLQLHL